MKYQFIKDHREQYRISMMCRVMEVSRSGYYDWFDRPTSHWQKEDQRLLGRIRQIHEQYRCTYGSDKTWQVLRTQGEACGRHRVARLRKDNNIEALRRKRFKAGYAARNSQPPAPNRLERNFTVKQPDQVWVGDTTFIPTRAGWLYLAIIVDLYARAVVGWAMSHRNNQELVADALKMAIEQRKPTSRLIHHTDQGATYSSSMYQTLLKQHHIIPSMSRKGNCYDNAVAESFFSTLKNELVFHRDFKTRDEARSAIFEFIEVFYNRQRHHQSLNYQIPLEYERMRSVA